jgi:hypothetical protein
MLPPENTTSVAFITEANIDVSPKVKVQDYLKQKTGTSAAGN